MVILTLNCGSSSVKYQVYDWDQKNVLANGIVERVTLGDSVINHKAPGIGDFTQEHECPTHTVAIELILKTITDPKHGVAYFNPAQQKAHQLSVRSGKIYDAQGRLFDTAQAGQRHAFNSKAGATFVVNPQGQLFAINRGGGAGGVHHAGIATVGRQHV
ncbi:MAG TPA: hypothetical protein PLC54_05830, partial [Spirochaetales bacterium]|nr:hypothetical protein [Spirochaetales bacterium]